MVTEEVVSDPIDFDVRQLPELVNPDKERMALARERQAKVWRGEKPDQWPILLSAPLTEEQDKIPSSDLKQAFHDRERMLCSQIRGACGVANARSDAVPSIRCNFGTGILLACFGLEQDVFPDKMPWLNEHLTKAEASEMTPDDIQPRGSFARGLEYMRFFVEILGDSVPVFHMDTQGPLDLAHLALGDTLFYEMYDDPEFVHHLLRLCVELNKKAHVWMKEVLGEPLGQHHHSSRLYAENMGVRICEDTTAIIGPEEHERFALPYTKEIAEYFGGAWVHYCGRDDELTKGACQIPEVRGINFGHIPGHVHDHDFESDMAYIHDCGKVYYGNWPRFDGETSADYLKRLQKWASAGALLPMADAAIRTDEPGFETAEKVKDFWYSL